MKHGISLDMSQTALIRGAATLTGGLNLSGTLPMDAVSGVTWEAAFGLGAVTSGWTSPGQNLFDISGGTTIKTIVGGYPDIRALAAALGVSPVSGSGAALVTKWYDQSGNGRDATQTNNANRPWIGLVYGKLVFGFGGVMTKYIDHPAMADQWLDLPASLVMNTQSLSVFSLVKPYTTTSRTASSVTNYFGAGTLSTIISNSGFGLYAPSSFFAGAPGSLAHLYDLSNFENYGNDPPNVGIQNQVVYGILEPSGGKYGANGITQTGAAITAATPTGGRIGASVGGFGDSSFGGRMYAVLISSTIFSGAQETAVKNALYNMRQIPTSSMIAGVTIDGASLDQGQGGVPGTLYTGEQNGGGFGWPEFLMDDLSSYPINWNNVAGSGFRIDQGTDFYTSIGNRTLFNPALPKNILIGPNSQYGNSLSQGRTIAQVKTDFSAYMAAVQADAWTKIATVVFPETDDGSDPNGQEYTSWVIAGAAAGGYEVLQAPFNFFNDPSNLNGDHLSIVGYRRMATAFEPQLRGWLGI